MIAGKARFYVAAALGGAIAGEALAGALVLGAVHLLPTARVPASKTLLVVSGALLTLGVIGGAFAGVLLLVRSYRRHEATKSPISS